MKTPVGRPPKLRTLTKDGRAFMLWVETGHMLWLDTISIRTGKSKAEIVRELINKAIQEEVGKND
jgi:hypothetical protein